MGRKRKDGDPLGLAGTRLACKSGRFYFIHRDGRWENVGTDIEVAKKTAQRLRNPTEEFGAMGYWFAEFLADCKLRVKAGKFSQRTLDDYTGYAAEDGPLWAAFGRQFPEHILPAGVQAYLEANATLDPPRPVPANRERAFLSSCISWLIRTGRVPGLLVNPCMRASGVQRNAEAPRARYVTHDEYRAVYEAGNRAVRLAMELVYRTLQRPEIDILAWTPANVRHKGQERVLRIVQGKTGRQVDIALTGRLDELVREAIGPVPQIHQPILHRLDGGAYTYDGLSAMLRQAQDKVRAAHRKTGGPLAEMPSFGLRDLKGKGATDMWLAGTPIEQIQLLCGHASKETTERYIKQRWAETAQPNAVEVL